mgnify:CR=1 FL=1
MLNYMTYYTCKTQIVVQWEGNMKKNSNFNYYSNVLKVTNDNFEKYNLSRYIKIFDNGYNKRLEKIYKQKLYNLVLNICNQYIYNYEYILKKDEIKFFYEFNLQMVVRNCIRELEEDILRYKKECK